VSRVFLTLTEKKDILSYKTAQNSSDESARLPFLFWWSREETKRIMLSKSCVCLNCLEKNGKRLINRRRKTFLSIYLSLSLFLDPIKSILDQKSHSKDRIWIRKEGEGDSRFTKENQTDCQWRLSHEQNRERKENHESRRETEQNGYEGDWLKDWQTVLIKDEGEKDFDFDEHS
jgi:hypothetical protein